MNAFDSTNIQPSTFKNTTMDLNTYAHRLTQTHIYVQTQKHSVTDSKLCSSLFSTSCRTYALQQTLALTLTLTKTHKKLCEFKNPSLILDSTTIFSLNRRTIALPLKRPSQSPGSPLLIPSYLTQAVQHVNSCFNMVPTL